VVTFRDAQLDSGEDRRSESDFRRRTGFTPEELAGKLVLDVGCGMGRFAEVATRWGAHVVGIDLSLAEEAAVENLRDRKLFFPGGRFPPAFRARELDYIYSIGVLHHTPNCERLSKSCLDC